VQSFCSLEAESLIVTALKKAEADRGIVLRVFETDGREARTSVEFLGRKCGVRAVNLLEEKTSAVDEAVWRLKRAYNDKESAEFSRLYADSVKLILGAGDITYRSRTFRKGVES